MWSVPVLTHYKLVRQLSTDYHADIVDPHRADPSNRNRRNTCRAKLNNPANGSSMRTRLRKYFSILPTWKKDVYIVAEALQRVGADTREPLLHISPCGRLNARSPPRDARHTMTESTTAGMLTYCSYSSSRVAPLSARVPPSCHPLWSFRLDTQ